MSSIIYNIFGAFGLATGTTTFTLYTNLLAAIIVGILGGITATAFLSKLFPGMADTAYLGAFAGLYLALWTHTSLWLNSLFEQYAGLYIITIFGIISIITLFFGLIQMGKHPLSGAI